MNQTNPSKSAFWTEIESQLEARETAGLGRHLVANQAVSPRELLRGNRRLLHFGSNDYLGIAWNPSVRQALDRGSNEQTGATASPLILGAGDEYHHLTNALAEWKRTESAIVFSSGYAANVGTVSAVVSRDDMIASDAWNHACLIDGCRLSRATTFVYPHADMDALRAILRENRARFRRAWIVTDTLFSMDGDCAPLREIQAFCDAFDAIAIADEAHASGVYGTQGCGLVDGDWVVPHRWIRTGTLSKAVGCCGGFVAGPSPLIRWLTNHARSWIYSTAPPPALLAASAMAISLLRGADAQRLDLHTRSRQLRQALNREGFATRTSDDSPIVPVYVRDSREALAWSQNLESQGIFVPAIRPPTVPRTTALLRISLNVAHSDADIAHLLQALIAARNATG